MTSVKPCRSVTSVAVVCGIMVDLSCGMVSKTRRTPCKTPGLLGGCRKNTRWLTGKLTE